MDDLGTLRDERMTFFFRPILKRPLISPFILWVMIKLTNFCESGFTRWGPNYSYSRSPTAGLQGDPMFDKQSGNLDRVFDLEIAFANAGPYPGSRQGTHDPSASAQFDWTMGMQRGWIQRNYALTHGNDDEWIYTPSTDWISRGQLRALGVPGAKNLGGTWTGDGSGL